MKEPKVGEYIYSMDKELYMITGVQYMTETMEVVCVQTDSRWYGKMWNVRYPLDNFTYVPEEELMLMKLAGKI